MANEIKIDKSKVETLMNKIIVMENFNLKTNAKNDPQMISEIQKEIQEIVKCYSNQ